MIKTLECVCPGENRGQGCFPAGIAAFFPAVNSTWKHKKGKRNCRNKPKLFKGTIGRTETRVTGKVNVNKVRKNKM